MIFRSRRMVHFTRATVSIGCPLDAKTGPQARAYARRAFAQLVGIRVLALRPGARIAGNKGGIRTSMDDLHKGIALLADRLDSGVSLTGALSKLESDASPQRASVLSRAALRFLLDDVEATWHSLMRRLKPYRPCAAHWREYERMYLGLEPSRSVAAEVTGDQAQAPSKPPEDLDAPRAIEVLLNAGFHPGELASALETWREEYPAPLASPPPPSPV